MHILNQWQTPSLLKLAGSEGEMLTEIRSKIIWKKETKFSLFLEYFIVYLKFLDNELEKY